MEELLTRFWSDLVGRMTGPFSFRFVLQPVMAIIYACRDGVKDAQSGRPAYFWTILSHPSERRRLLAEGWHAVLRVIVLGLLMDTAYQLIVFRRLYPLEIVVIVLVLAFLPYLLLRGPINRIARYWIHSGQRAAMP
jgi:hypothetical protein